MVKVKRLGAAALAAVFALCLTASPVLSANAQVFVAATPSTDVELAVVSSFELVRVLPDGADASNFVGTADAARGLVLEARAEGASGEVAATWTRAVDGVLDAAFSADGLAHALSGDYLQGGRTYRYTLTAVDGAGTSRAVEYGVDIRYRTADRVAHAPGSDERIDVAGDVYDDGKRGASAYVKQLADSSAPGDALSVLARAAAEQGKSIEAAWSVGMTVPAGVDAPPYVGLLTVSFPYPLGAASLEAMEQSPFMRASLPAGPDVLFLAVGEDEPELLSTAYANRRASFAVASLGTFAVLSGGPTVTHAINATASAGGSIDPEGLVAVQDGYDATFVIVPDEGYEVKDVTVDGVSQGPLSSYTFENVVRGHAIEASFALVTPAPTLWTLAITAGEGGAVHFGSQIVEGRRDFRVEQGTSASLAFLPYEGWRVNDVRVDGVSIGSPASYVVPALSHDVSVDVTFVRGSAEPSVTHVVTAEAGEGGSVSPERVRVPHGGEAAFSFLPNEGYRVEQVLVDGQAVEASNSLTLRNVTADRAVQVLFGLLGETGDAGGEGAGGGQAAGTYTVSASAGAHGAVSPQGKVTVAEGADASFAFLPEAGYRVARVDVDGQSLAFAPGSWTFPDVHEDHTLRVEFAPVPALATTGDTRNLAVGWGLLAVAFAGSVLCRLAWSRSAGRR